MQTNIEIEIYINAIRIFLEIIKLTTSKENAEKVVNDPSKPIMKKNLTKFSLMFFEKSEVTRYPIKKQPIIFTVSVP